MNAQQGYDYINDVRNPLPVELFITGTSRDEALKILAVLKWLSQAKETEK